MIYDPYASYLTQRTSREAKESLDENITSLRAAVLELIRESGQNGVTCEELESVLAMKHQTASARIRDLAKAGRIMDSGMRRKTSSGRAAIVWVLSEYFWPNTQGTLL
jgi:predicted transcriptional regulator